MKEKIDLETAKKFRDIAFNNMQKYKSELDSITKAYLKVTGDYYFYDGVVKVLENTIK